MATFSITKPRNWFDIQKDGVGGENGRVITTIGPYVSINVNTANSKLNIMYLDISANTARLATGVDAITTFSSSGITGLSGLTDFVSYCGDGNVLQQFYIKNSIVYLYHTTNGITSYGELNVINSSSQTNPKLLKVVDIANYTNYNVFLSVGSNIYLLLPNLSNIILDYNGNGFNAIMVSTNRYLAYTTSTGINITDFLGTLLATISGSYTNPSLAYLGSQLILFALSGGMIYGGVVTGSSVTFGNPLISAETFKIYTFGSILSCFFIKAGKLYNFKINATTLAPVTIQLVSKYEYMVLDNTFDYAVIGNEEYIAYIDSENVLHQAWNPVNEVQIKIDTVVTNLDVKLNGISGTFHPAFSSSISDYMTVSANSSGLNTCIITVNDSQIITDSQIYTHQILKITDTTGSHYFVKICPTNTFSASTTISSDYIPGYYSTALTFNGNYSPYSLIYDSNGSLVWYRREVSNTICSLLLGNGPNRVVTCIFDTVGPRTIVDLHTMKEQSFLQVSSILYSDLEPGLKAAGWDVHEALEINCPGIPSRTGNIIHITYYQGFYIQELDVNHTIVWEIHSRDYFNTTDPEFFHVNSIDVHPITGDILCSFRTCSTVAAFNYTTKNLDWVIDSNGQLLAQVITPSLTKFLTISNDIVYGGVQYNGTSAQHDARWQNELDPLTPGNLMVSIYDNQSFNGRPYARGVIFEINTVAVTAVYRGAVYSNVGTSGYMGSYNIKFEANNTTSHVVDWVQQHPCLIEYAGDPTTKMPTDMELFRMNMSGDIYRISKAMPSEVSIKSMRKTSGMPYTTYAL